nr:leucine-rich repeat protein [Eubacteriales bacterium]
SEGETVYFAVKYYSPSQVDKLFNVHIDYKESYVDSGVFYVKDTDADTGNDFYYVGGYKFNTPTDVTILSEINGIPVTYIAESAFEDCEYLTSVTIPDSVKEVYDYTFCDCKNLKTVTLCEGIDSIGYSAFYGTAIESITIPSSVKTIYDEAFCDCRNLKTIILNEGIENIYDWAFGNTAVESVTIPASVKDFNGSVFACCYDLKSISIADANETYKSVDNVVYSKDGTALIFTLPSLTGTFVVPEGVKSIEYYSFYASLISGVKLPSTLETIGYSAFAGCGIYCVDVPASVTEIGSYAFSDSNVEAIIINNKDTNLSGAFVEDTVTIYGHTGSTAETYANNRGNKFVSIDLEEGVECTHSFVNYEIITAPTCTSKGLAKTKCAICGAQGENAEIEMTEHNAPVGVCVDCGHKESYVSDVELNQSITCTVSDAYQISTACFTATKDGTYTATISDMNDIDIFVVASNTARNDFYYEDGKETMVFELKAGEQIFIAAMTRDPASDTSFKATVTCNHTNMSTTDATCAVCGIANPNYVAPTPTPTPTPEQTPTDYRILDGANSSWTQNSDGSLSVRGSGEFSKFVGVKVDGALIDAENYTVKKGSTIVTLKADYLNTLSVGSHTLDIVWKDGSASTTFTVNAKEVAKTDTESSSDTKSPQTGNNSIMLLWIALLFASGVGVSSTSVFVKKKKKQVD